MSVPLLDLDAQYRPLRENILAAITRVCDSQRFIMGPEIDGLERELCGLLGVKHAIAVSSGTDALLLALMALGIKAGDEVITTTFSFFATAGAIVRLGATPVLVDIDPETFNIDPEQTAAAITPRPNLHSPTTAQTAASDTGAEIHAPTRAPARARNPSRWAGDKTRCAPSHPQTRDTCRPCSSSRCDASAFQI